MVRALSRTGAAATGLGDPQRGARMGQMIRPSTGRPRSDGSLEADHGSWRLKAQDGAHLHDRHVLVVQEIEARELQWLAGHELPVEVPLEGRGAGPTGGDLSASRPA